MPLILYLLLTFATDTRPVPVKPSFTPLPLTACAIVTRADVEQAIGRRVNDGNEEKEGPASTCDYAAKGGLVSISIQRLAAKPNLEAEIAALRKGMPGSTVRDAAGFPGAFYLDLPGAGTQLHILNGDRDHLMVSILGFGEAPQVSSAAARIARAAIKRL